MGVPIKGFYSRSMAQEEKLKRKKSVAEWGGTYTNTYKKFARLVQLASCGLAAGTAFTMLGVGGGVVLAPALCLMTDMDHATVLGTTLTAMIPASFVAMLGHLKTGTMAMSGAVPLGLAAAFGSFSEASSLSTLMRRPYRLALVSSS